MHNSAKRPIVAGGLLIPLLSLAACQPTSVYKPYTDTATWGYSDVPIRPDYYEIGYSSQTTDNPTVSRYYATLRAAELTLDNNKFYFEIIQARPGETPQTWAAADLASTRPGAADMTAIQAANNTVSLNNASSVLLVHLLDAPTPAALDALDLLRAGQQKGIIFDSTVQARLAASAASTQSH